MPRWDDGRFNPATIANLIVNDHYLVTWCTICRKPGRDIGPRELLERGFPESFVLLDIAPLLRCSRCDRKGCVEIQVGITRVRPMRDAISCDAGDRWVYEEETAPSQDRAES